MVNNTKIEWTDKSWNPITGCLHNCDYCYAKSIYNRFKYDFTPTFHENRLIEPYKLQKSKKIFVGSVSDIFGEWISNEWVEKVLDVVKSNKNHIFQFLTKNPKRLIDFDFPENCWVGASVTNQNQYNLAMNYLPKLDNIKFLSCEPLLSEVDVGDKIESIDWVIIGACSYPKPKQPEKEWVEKIISKSTFFNKPIFLKPNLKVVNHELYKEFPDKHQTKLKI